NVSLINPVSLENWWKKHVGEETPSPVEVPPPQVKEGPQANVAGTVAAGATPTVPPPAPALVGGGAAGQDGNAVRPGAAVAGATGTENGGGGGGAGGSGAAAGGKEEVAQTQSGPQDPTRGEASRPGETTSALPSNGATAGPRTGSPPAEDPAALGSPASPEATAVPAVPAVPEGSVKGKEASGPAAAFSGTANSSARERTAGGADSSGVITAWVQAPLCCCCRWLCPRSYEMVCAEE
ncbi:uncharacterized protein Tco025E_04023, partial [Trypanosoma conorhini]